MIESVLYGNIKSLLEISKPRVSGVTIKQNVTPESKFNGETGTIENIRIVSSNHGGTAVGSDGLNGGTTLGEGVVFGDNAVKFVKVMAPKVVYAKAEDYDRLLGVGWRAIIGVGCTLIG